MGIRRKMMAGIALVCSVDMMTGKLLPTSLKFSSDLHYYFVNNF